MKMRIFALVAFVLFMGSTNAGGKICYNQCRGDPSEDTKPECRFKCVKGEGQSDGWFNRKFPTDTRFYDTRIRDKVITFEEFCDAFLAVEYIKKIKQLKKVFKKADTDGNGVIDYEEFKAAPWDFEEQDDRCAVRRFRDYYIQVEKILWDYLPSGQNLVTNDTSLIEEALTNKADRVGSKYYKYVYKRYTDTLYREEITSPAYQGYVGPMIHGEVGDVIRVHLRSLAHMPISIHPHGALYDKINEGAFYEDNTNSSHKFDDRVYYGQNITVTWHLVKEFAPTDEDPNCLNFAYHSHNHAEREINAGLMSLLIVCKPGVLNDDLIHPRRKDVDKEFLLYYDTIDEGLSLLLPYNLDRCGDPTLCHELYNEREPDFMDSLVKDQLNGFLFGNSPPLQVCAGEKVAWYIFSLDAEIHAAEIHGHTWLTQHTRKSTIGIWSATFITATTVSTKPGKWLISCLNMDHLHNGMSAYLQVNKCENITYGDDDSQHDDGDHDYDHDHDHDNDSVHGKTREYFLAAETVEWNYAPSGMNKYDGGSLTDVGTVSADLYTAGPGRIGGTYKKSRFVEYESSNFTQKKERTPDQEHLAMLGPVLQAEVGDKIKVTLKNKTPFPVSLYMQGVKFNKSEDGQFERLGVTDGPLQGNIVLPGETGYYRATVPESISPADDDPPCIAYIYHSYTNMVKDVNTGLVGPVKICKKDSLDEDTGRQKHIDKEFYLLFADWDENESWYLDMNIAHYLSSPPTADDPDFAASNVMRSINGLAYGNLNGLNMCQGDQVVWHVMGLGANDGLHGVKFNGNNILTGGVYRDAYYVIPGSTYTGLMNADNCGIWSVSCHNTAHFSHGEKALYTVEPCGGSGYTPPPHHSGITRTYYIAAVERKWDYSPKTLHPITGEDYSKPNSTQYIRVRNDSGYLGSIYNKALFVEYTNGDFDEEVPKEPKLGILGPILRCGVYDTLKVVFKNMASRPYSVHPQGLEYTKHHEGQMYQDGHSSTGDAVAPGDIYEYEWYVPEDAGPKSFQANCHGSLYQSATDPVKDSYSGLVGQLVICKPGILGSDNKRHDSITKEFPLLMMIWDENQSHYLQQNIDEFGSGVHSTADDFEESNTYDSVNGLIFNNLQGLVMNQYETVAWYGSSLGDSEGYHQIHFHGHTYYQVTHRNHTADVLDVFPAVKETSEMYCFNPGTWLVHCHVGAHTEHGMIATYTVVKFTSYSKHFSGNIYPFERDPLLPNVFK